MAASNDSTFPPGKHRYRSVTDGVAMAQRFLSSGLSISAFARQYGVSARMVKYWSGRAQMLASASTAEVTPSPPLLEHVATVDDASMPPVPPPAPEPPAHPAPPAPADVGRIEIILPGGTRVVVEGSVPPALLRQAVHCLTGGQC